MDAAPAVGPVSAIHLSPKDAAFGNVWCMRTKVPPAFQMLFLGPEGEYELDFAPTDEWDGIINVTIDGIAMRWSVDYSELEVDGGLVLGGMTIGSENLWDDQFWFELRMGDHPPVIRYWGNQVIWREDNSFSAQIPMSHAR